MKIGSQGKHAITHYRVLERFRYMTWVECKLETERTHQIRGFISDTLVIHYLMMNAMKRHIPLRGQNLPKYKQFIQNVFEVLPRHTLSTHIH